MDKSEASPKFLILCFILLYILILSLASDDNGGSQNPEIKQSLGQRITSTATELGKSSLSSWNKLKSLVYRAQKNFFPPTLDFRSRDELPSSVDGEPGGTKERVKSAAEKSLETSEAAFEETAESAATVVGNVMHKTKEKVKDKLSKGREAKEEL
ncbi:hypothetical protein Ancab_026744 [Ancistrocladus abbreviatus]